MHNVSFNLKNINRMNEQTFIQWAINKHMSESTKLINQESKTDQTE